MVQEHIKLVLVCGIDLSPGQSFSEIESSPNLADERDERLNGTTKDNGETLGNSRKRVFTKNQADEFKDTARNSLNYIQVLILARGVPAPIP
jgi:hypothetical protein